VTQSLIGINFLSSHAVSGPGGESTESSNFSKDFGYREEPFWAQPRGTVFPTLPRGAPLPAGWGRVNRSLVNSAPEPPRFPRRPAASAAVMASQAIGLDDMLSEIAGTGIRHVRWVVVGDGRSLPPPTAVTASVHWQWSPPSLRWVAASPDASELSELCVGVRGNARHPRRAASHFAEGLFCPPAGGAPALLDGRNPLEYLSP
jgi:hypothetical protein